MAFATHIASSNTTPEMLTSEQLATFQQTGHVTVPGVLTDSEVAAALADISAWSTEFLRDIRDDQKAWFLENTGAEEAPLRKLDNPVFHRDVFRQLAHSPKLLSIVEQLIGRGVSVFFSQVFMKPPEAGGPKPVHQDNFYFGPDSPDATLTVWIALDDATVENGCLYYGDGSHQGEIVPHIAPPDQPFNLQVPKEYVARFQMTPAPVPAGGISFHHGNTWHQSSANTSPHPRRAVAMHFLRNDATLIAPALAYDENVVVVLTPSTVD